MRRRRSDFGDADWLDWKGLVQWDMLKLGDLLKCRYLLEHVMSDKGLLLLLRRMMMKRKMIWQLLLLLGFLELDNGCWDWMS